MHLVEVYLGDSNWTNVVAIMTIITL